MCESSSIRHIRSAQEFDLHTKNQQIVIIVAIVVAVVIIVIVETTIAIAIVIVVAVVRGCVQDLAPFR